MALVPLVPVLGRRTGPAADALGVVRTVMARTAASQPAVWLQPPAMDLQPATALQHAGVQLAGGLPWGMYTQ